MRSIKIVPLCVLLALLLSSCSGERLHDMTIIQAVGLDAGNSVTAAIQYLDLNRTAGGTDALEGNITAVQTGSGDTVSESLTAANKTLAGAVFFGQNKLFVLGREYAETDLFSFAEYLRCSRDSRPDVLVAMSDTAAEDVLNSKASGARVPAENIVDLISGSEEYGAVPSVSVNDVLNRCANPQCDVYLPVLTADDERVYPSGIAVFSYERLAGILRGDDALGFMLAGGTLKKGPVCLTADGKTHTFELLGFQRRSRMVGENGRLVWELRLNVRLYADEAGDAETLAAMVEDRFSAYTAGAVTQCFRLKCDPFGMAQAVAKDCPAYGYLFQDSWRDRLSEITVRCTVTATVRQ